MSEFGKRILSLLAAMVFAVTAATSALAAEPPLIEPRQDESNEHESILNEYIIDDAAEEADDGAKLLPEISCSDIPDSDYVKVIILAPELLPLGHGDHLVYRVDNDEVWREYGVSLEVAPGSVVHTKVIWEDGTETAEVSMKIGATDAVPPTAPTFVADIVTWVRDKVDVAIASGTDADSGYAATQYRVGEDGEWTDYNAPLIIGKPCTVYARGVDAAGNYSEIVSVDIANFDTIAPDYTTIKVSISTDGGFTASESTTISKYTKNPVSVEISGGSDTQSGIDYYEYQTAANADALKADKWQKLESGVNPKISSDFSGFVFVRCTDKVGNVSQPAASEGFVIDSTAPTISGATLTPSTITDSKVTVKFNVTDNTQLRTVTVNGNYVGIYNPSFTAYRNGDYVIEAIDIAGNKASKTVTVKNINSTPFTVMKTFNSLDSENFTPSSWTAAQSAASELQTKLNDGSSETKINSASEKLVAAMESLVQRGDGTESLRLIESIGTDYKKDDYTDSSWANMEGKIAEVKAILEDPERTQEQVDTARRSLEVAVTDLIKRGDFTALDRIIAQCEALDSEKYDHIKFAALKQALEEAESLSRTDSSQEDVDACYNVLIAAMNGLKEAAQTKKTSTAPILFVILGLLIIAAAAGLFIMRKQKKSYELPENDDEPEDNEYDEYEDNGEYDRYSEEENEYGDDQRSDYGDLHFSDDEEEDDEEEDDDDAQNGFTGGYIGSHRR